jgi:hypothetical protein
MVLIRNAEERRQARMIEVHKFQSNEAKLKEERRLKGRTALEEWEVERQK